MRAVLKRTKKVPRHFSLIRTLGNWSRTLSTPSGSSSRSMKNSPKKRQQYGGKKDKTKDRKTKQTIYANHSPPLLPSGRFPWYLWSYSYMIPRVIVPGRLCVSSGSSYEEISEKRQRKTRTRKETNRTKKDNKKTRKTKTLRKTPARFFIML